MKSAHLRRNNSFETGSGSQSIHTGGTGSLSSVWSVSAATPVNLPQRRGGTPRPTTTRQHSTESFRWLSMATDVENQNCIVPQ